MIQYGGDDAAIAAYEDARVAVLPVPYDGTSTWIKGANKGPEAILEASANMELYDIETQSEVYRKGIFTLAPATNFDSPEEMAAEVETRVSRMIDDGKFPVILGGEHSVSIGAFKAFASKVDDLSVLQLDAHTDLRRSYEGSEFNHACVMTHAQVLVPIVQVGIRSMSEEETDFIEEDRVFYSHIMQQEEFWMQKASDLLTDKVYVTIDLDVLDPSIMPSTGTPEPDGLYYREVIEFLKLINQEHEIVGFDVVELCPNNINKAPDFLASKLIYQLLSMIFNTK
jgi:agmatinase